MPITWNGLPPIRMRVAGLLGRAVAVGIIAGDLGADQYVGLAHVGWLQESPAPFLRGQDALFVHAALEMEMLGELLPFDHDRLGERAESLGALAGQDWVAARASRLRPSMGGQIFQTSGATMRAPGILRRSSTMVSGQVAENRSR